MADPDIDRAARYMIKEHGDYAWPRAVNRAKRLLARGQGGANVIWIRVAHEIARLRTESGDKRNFS